jgi:hypothetical protein
VSSLGITVFGVIALTFMMVMYAFERRLPQFCGRLRSWVPLVKRVRFLVRRLAIRRGGTGMERRGAPALLGSQAKAPGGLRDDSSLPSSASRSTSGAACIT